MVVLAPVLQEGREHLRPVAVANIEVESPGQTTRSAAWMPSAYQEACTSGWSLSNTMLGAFNSVCTQALTLRGYVELVARRFGHEPRLEFAPWDEFASRVDPQPSDHRAHRTGPAVLRAQGDDTRVVLEDLITRTGR